MCVVAINVTDVVNAGLQHAIVLRCNHPNKSCQLQLLHTKAINCNCCLEKLPIAIVAYESCQLQLLHTKIANCNCCIQKLSQL